MIRDYNVSKVCFCILPKKISDDQKIKILDSFMNGLDLKELSELYGFSISTITRQLKIKLGNEKFKNIRESNKSRLPVSNTSNTYSKNKKEYLSEIINFSENDNNLVKNDKFESNDFFEIVPLNNEIDLENQKELSSVPLEEVDFPKIIYMIVDNKIELIIKLLRDLPEWEFLPDADLNRKTIQIYYDLKKAKSNTSKDQRVIKVPNTNVFKIVSPLLLSRGISRIVTEDKLISI